MWKIGKIKENGKKAFKANYWKAVAVSLIAASVLGVSGVFFGMSGFRDRSVINETNDGEAVNVDEDDEGNLVVNAEENGRNLIVMVDDDGYVSVEQGREEYSTEIDNEAAGAAAVIVGFFIILAVLVGVAVAVAYDILVVNPLSLGFKKFYLKTQDEPAEISNIGYGFDNNYKNNIKTLFFRDLYLVLWTLLFIIPGIVKSYEYRMIPYLLCDNPGMTKEEAFAKSKAMMNGNKFKAFLLDLSFIGWDILSGLTLGFLGVFYVEPYRHSTRAALYKELMGSSAA